MNHTIPTFLRFIGREIAAATRAYFGPLKAVIDYIATATHTSPPRRDASPT